ALLLEAEGDIARDREMRKQGIALEHHVDRPAVRRHASEVGAVEQHAPLVRRLKAREQAQQRGLAAAGGAKQGKEFTLENVERQPIDADHATETLADTLEPDQWPRGRIGPGRKDSARALADSRQVGVGVGTRHAGTLPRRPWTAQPVSA